MPVSTTLHVDPQAAGAALSKRLDMLSDAEPLMREIGEHLVLATDDNFVHERSPSGEPWAPLSPATYEIGFRKRSSGPAQKRTGKGARSGGGTLTDTAAFARYKQGKKILQEQGVRGGLRGSIYYRVTPDAVVVGAGKVYAAAQQKGLGERSNIASRRRFGAIPARPFVGVSDESRSIIGDMVRRYVQTGG